MAVFYAPGNADLQIGIQGASQRDGVDFIWARTKDTHSEIRCIRSIHGDFSDKIVSDADLQAVLEASARAADASNAQCYAIVVSRDPEKIRKITSYRAGCLFLNCADYTRMIKGYKHYLDRFYKEWARAGAKPTTSEGQMLRRLKKSGFVDAQSA